MLDVDLPLIPGWLRNVFRNVYGLNGGKRMSILRKIWAWLSSPLCGEHGPEEEPMSRNNHFVIFGFYPVDEDKE